jgi:tetratricopeptide (TPR) repeat protein
LFATGSNEKCLEILKDILGAINIKIEGTKENLDINLVCVKDVVKLNQASINFWLENFDEARMLLEEVITYYESTDDELYLIKMVNFVSVAFTYLAWIYAKRGGYDDAEKAFLHGLKVIKSVKQHTKHRSSEGKEDMFINTKSKKIFIFGKILLNLDQLINFYSFSKQFWMCQAPLLEILKIMDKDTYKYDLDVGPQNHVYYYTTAILYVLKNESYKVDLGKALHYLINIMKIVFNNVDSFEVIPPIFYKAVLDIVDSIRRNKGKTLFFQDLNAMGIQKDKDYKEFLEYKENIEPEDVKYP